MVGTVISLRSLRDWLADTFWGPVDRAVNCWINDVSEDD